MCLLTLPVNAVDLEAWLSTELVNQIRINEPELETANIRINLQNRDRLSKVRPGQPEIRIKPNQSLVGYSEIPVYFVEKGGRVLAKVTVPVTIDIYREFIKTTTVIQSGGRLATSNVTQVRLNAAGLPANALRNFEDANGKEVVATIAKNVVVTAAMLRKKPIIRRGQPITMHIDRDGVSLRVDGIALQDGYKDAIISVKTVRYNKESKGKVLDDSNVQIIFSH